jgi:hypothetical protein
VIPTLLLVGFAFGRWWKVTVPAGVVAWDLWLIADGSVSGLRFAAGAASLALVNLVVGVVLFHSVRAVIRRIGTVRTTLPRSAS